ncbi:MAG: hypothetical protein ABI175_09090, partial [Polyangiales bacterium]
WVLDIPGGDPLLLKGTNLDAPSNHLVLRRRGMQIAVGCDDTNIIVATQRAISSWSSTERKRLWSHELQYDVAYDGTPGSSGLNTTCSTLNVTKGVVTVPLAAGKVAKLHAADGSEVP